MKPSAGRNPLALAVEHLFPQSNVATLRRVAFVAAALVLATTVAFAQAGQLDSTFGTGGIFTTNFTAPDATIDNAMAIQGDGKIVLGGAGPTGAILIRLNPNGTLDTSFGSGGVLTPSFGNDGLVVSVLVQPNQQIVAYSAGFLGSTVGRFNPDGSLDTTFGNGGFATTRSINSGPGILSVMALQADGKILVTGAGLIGRYTSTGQLDTSFGTSGIAALNSTVATGIAVQPDGRILITTGSGPQSELFGSPILPSPGAGALARYTTTGTLDTTFGVAGQVSCVASAAGIALQSNGKIVVAGTITSALLTEMSEGGVVADNQTGFGVVRYNANGSIDTTFNPGSGIGTGGGVITGFGNSFPNGAAFALAVQSNGEIVVAGTAGAGLLGGSNFTSSSFVLARYTINGHLDTSFGNNGTVTTTLDTISFITTLALQSDGKLVAAGNTGHESSEFIDNFAVARYLTQ
jgi:uncharacterized delta-60 repeat protein